MAGWEELHKELWGKDKEFSGIEDATISVPLPQFSLEPGYGFRMNQASLRDFPLTGISLQKEVKTFKKLRTENAMPCGTKRLLVRSEYDHIEKILKEAEVEKWSRASSASGSPPPGTTLDYEVSGQPGSGA
jgi:hypothetical protein